MLYGGFVIRMSDGIVNIETPFVSRRLIETGYFHRLLAAFFLHQKWAPSSRLKWLPYIPFSCEPIILDATVQEFIDEYGHNYC